MGHTVWYCSSCGDGPLGVWHTQCTSCGHLYCGSCHTEDPYAPKAVQDETKEQDFERPSTTSIPFNSEASPAVPDHSATPTKPPIDRYKNPQILSPEPIAETVEVLHLMSQNQTSSEQENSHLEDEKTIDGPPNSPGFLSDVSGSNTSSLKSFSSSSEAGQISCSVPDCGVTFGGKHRKSKLRRHLRRKHPGLPSYSCAEPECGKAFMRSDSRLKHYLKHHPWLARRTRPSFRPKPIFHGQNTRDKLPLDPTSSNTTARQIDSLGLLASQPTYESVRTDFRFEGFSNNSRSVLEDWMNEDVINTEPWGAANGRYSESSDRPPSIVSEDAITLDELKSRNDPLPRIAVQPHLSHRDSLSVLGILSNSEASKALTAQAHNDLVQDMNDGWDNQSVRSIESAVTLVSIISGYTAVEMESATIELRRVLQEDLNLTKLYRLAIEDANIGPERLQRNLGRLLKQMAQDLKVEANKELERLTSRFVAVKARNIAHCIVQDFQVTKRPQQNIERPEESESDQEDNPIDENRFEDLTTFRTFLVESGAFRTFQSRLEAFVHPKCLPVIEAKIDMEDADTSHWSSKSFLPPSWLHSIYMSIIFATGFVEPQIPSHAVRLKWQCKCGHSFSSDVYECRPGGVNRLKERMQRSGCLKVTLDTYDEHEPDPGYTLQIPSWCQAVSDNLSTSFTAVTRASADSMCLPLYRISKTAKVSAASRPTDPSSERERYLLICMHRTQHHVNVNQESLKDVTTDRKLFCFLKTQLRLHRGRLRSLISMKRVQKIFFVKFRLHKRSVAQVRHHKYCCTQQNCECIPPQSKVIKPPMGTGEYDCNPSGPPDTWPPVCPEFMMHMYHSPQCIAEDDTSILEQLPKKMDCKLDESTGVPSEGWGLYFQEDIDISTIIAVVFIALFVASLLFLVLWTIFKDDIQGASGVSAYIVAVASMAGIWIATKSKSFS